MKVLALIAVMCCCCCFLGGQAKPLSRLRPMPLDSSFTWNYLFTMSTHAHKEDTDHKTRLIPVLSDDMLEEENSCCVNAMLLNYYLSHILRSDEHVDEKYPHISFVRSDLQNIANTLNKRCESDDYSDHVIVKQFKKAYNNASKRHHEKTRNKAVGETIILFHYLFESCSAGI